MRTQIAKSDSNLCPGCGTRCEKGEWITTDDGVDCHTGCTPREVRSSAATQTQTPGFLFDDPVQAESERAKEKVGAVSLAIHGATYSGSQDRERLTKHLLAVFELMKDGEFRATVDVADEVGCLETTAHARIRQLRSIGHRVPKRWVKGECGASGHYEYALEVNRSLVSDGWEKQDGYRAA